MAAYPKPRLTPEEYLEIERAAETRHEYFKGEMFAMAGGTPRHSLIGANLTRELGNALLDRPCFVMGPDVRTNISSDGLYTYPDVVVVCGEMRFTDDRADTIVNPTLIVEVLSPSTEAYDRGFKFAQYRGIESLKEYVLVSQAEARVEVYRRGADGKWSLSDFAGLEAICAFESVNCQIPLSRIYHRVTFDANPFPRQAVL